MLFFFWGVVVTVDFWFLCWVSGTNIQTNEEVAIKLVSSEALSPSLFFIFGLLNCLCFLVWLLGFILLFKISIYC